MPESAVLLACARQFVRQGPPDELLHALRQDLDWPTLLRMAEEHSILPLLYWEIKRACPDHLPQDLHARFEDNARSTLAHLDELSKPQTARRGPIIGQ